MLWFYDLKEPGDEFEYYDEGEDEDEGEYKMLPLASECRTDLCTVPGLVAMGLLFPPFCCYFATLQDYMDRNLFGCYAEWWPEGFVKAFSTLNDSKYTRHRRALQRSTPPAFLPSLPAMKIVMGFFYVVPAILFMIMGTCLAFYVYMGHSEAQNMTLCAGGYGPTRSISCLLCEAPDCST